MGPPPKNPPKSSTTPKSNASAKPANASTNSAKASAKSATAGTSGKKKSGGGRPRKDKENPLSSPDQGVTTSTASGANDQAEVTEENRILREKLAEIQAEMNQLKARKIAGPETDGSTGVNVIPRPKGEAGDRKRGFILIEAMGLNKGQKNQTLYNSILDTVRKNIARANLDLAIDFRHQDVEKLGQVFRMTRKKQPYMDRKRFPADWATAEIVKQYLHGQRKTKKRKRQVVADDDESDNKSGEDDEEDEETGAKGSDDEGFNSGEDEPAASKRRRIEITSD